MESTQSESSRFSGLLADVLRMPATGLTCLAAITVTLISWITSLSGIGIDPRGFLVLPWTPITSALAHVNSIHLIFNLVWLWRFGSWIEHRIGSVRTLLVYGALAVVSAASEFAWHVGGIGLSGVVYGLFGLLWMRGRVDHDVARVLGRSTTILLVVWFFLCIVLTQLNVLPVANMAHFSGAVAGAGLGWAWNSEGLRRRAAVLFSCTGFVVALEAATVGRFLVNSGPGLAFSRAALAHDAVERRDFAEGLSQSLLAIECDPTNGSAHWYLGCAQVMTGREDDGLASFREADRLGTRTVPPDQAWLEWMHRRLFDVASSEDWETIGRLANTMLRIDPRCVDTWTWIGQAESHAGRPADACNAFERAFDLDPSLPEVRLNLVWAKLTRAQLAFENRELDKASAEIESGLALAPEDASLLALKRQIALKHNLAGKSPEGLK